MTTKEKPPFFVDASGNCAPPTERQLLDIELREVDIEITRLKEKRLELFDKRNQCQEHQGESQPKPS